MSYPSGDAQWKDKTVTSVGAGGEFTCDDGWTFGVPKDSAVMPHVGDSARFYGRGIGYTVRGLFLNGAKVFYRTEQEQKREDAKSLRKFHEQKRLDFEKSRAKLDREFCTLPKEFKDRIAGFRAFRSDWRAEFEAYEMSVCVDAVNIATAMKTAAKVEAFGKLSWDEQKAAVPDLSDGHSGNSFGCAVRLAWLWLTDAALVAKEHGALCPLVGCKALGCPPAR